MLLQSWQKNANFQFNNMFISVLGFGAPVSRQLKQKDDV